MQRMCIRKSTKGEMKRRLIRATILKNTVLILKTKSTVGQSLMWQVGDLLVLSQFKAPTATGHHRLLYRPRSQPHQSSTNETPAGDELLPSLIEAQVVDSQLEERLRREVQQELLNNAPAASIVSPYKFIHTSEPVPSFIHTQKGKLSGSANSGSSDRSGHRLWLGLLFCWF